MTNIHKNLVLYIAKCLLGCAIAFGLSVYFHIPDISWFLISIVLVVSPDGEEAIPLAVTRIKANLIGSFSSLVFLLAGLHNLLGVGLAFALAITLCFVFKVMTASRVALAAVVIVMMHNPEIDIWETVTERILSVVGGCLIGLILTFIFHKEVRKKHKKVVPNKHGE